MKNDETNPFRLEDLVVPEPPPKTSSKAGPKVAHKKGELFIKITPAQAAKLSGESIVVTVFFHLMFRSYKAYRKPFLFPPDALGYAGISRHAQLRALRSLEKLGLISVERGGARKPPLITIIGAAKEG